MELFGAQSYLSAAASINWAKKWKKFVKFFVTKEGYKMALDGLWVTIRVSFFGFLLGITLGSIVAIVKMASRHNKVAKGFDVVGEIYTNFFRGTPIVVQLLLSHFVIFPILGLAYVNSVVEAILIFGLNSGAYVAEVMRSGILSVDIGQTEAGRAVGLSYTTTMTRIVLPQAFKNAVPSLGNELIALIKDTSVVSFIALIDLTEAFRLIGAGSYDFFVPYIILAQIYLAVVLALTFGIKRLERRLRKGDRR